MKKVLYLLSLIAMICLAAPVAKAQEIDSAARKQNVPVDIKTPSAEPSDVKKMDLEVDSSASKVKVKKAKVKKEKKVKGMPEINANPAVSTDSIPQPKGKNGKTIKPKKVNPKKAAKAAAPVEVPKAKPGAEAKALSEVKDPEDRALKGPSGQKVFSSPKGGKYYIDANGNRKYIRKDTK